MWPGFRGGKGGPGAFPSYQPGKSGNRTPAICTFWEPLSSQSGPPSKRAAHLSGCSQGGRPERSRGPARRPVAAGWPPLQWRAARASGGKPALATDQTRGRDEAPRISSSLPQSLWQRCLDRHPPPASCRRSHVLPLATRSRPLWPCSPRSRLVRASQDAGFAHVATPCCCLITCQA